MGIGAIMGGFSLDKHIPIATLIAFAVSIFIPAAEFIGDGNER